MYSWIAGERRGKAFRCSCHHYCQRCSCLLEIRPEDVLALSEGRKDAGRIHHAEWADPPGREPLWEVIEWGGTWFTVRGGELANPGMHPTREEAMAAGRGAR